MFSINIYYKYLMVDITFWPEIPIELVQVVCMRHRLWCLQAQLAIAYIVFYSFFSLLSPCIAFHPLQANVQLPPGPTLVPEAFGIKNIFRTFLSLSSPCIAFHPLQGCPRKLIFSMPPYLKSPMGVFLLLIFTASIWSRPSGPTLVFIHLLYCF